MTNKLNLTIPAKAGGFPTPAASPKG